MSSLCKAKDTSRAVAEKLPQSVTPAVGDRALFGAFLLGLAMLLFVAGSASCEFRWPIYKALLSSPSASLGAWMQRMELTSDVLESDLWHVTDYEQRGVVRHDTNQAFDGYTLFTSAHSTSAYLVDMKGRTVHRWSRSFRDVWNNPPHIPRPVPDRFIHWRRVHLFPNGDLLAIFVGVGDSPCGYGLVKIEKDSNIVWKYAGNVHHDLDVQPDGSIVTLTHEFRPPHEIPHLYTERQTSYTLDDYVVRLSPDGEQLQKVSVLEALAKSPYDGILRVVENFEWDPLHANSVDVIDSAFAERHAFSQPGQILISLRSRDVLAILDMDDSRIAWATYGPFHRQHDAEVLSNGNLLVFDNRGHAGPGGPTRIIELDPASLEVRWSFAGDEAEWLYSRTRGMQQVLPNHNLLITEADGGRILEVTRDGDIVWEFRNPNLHENDQKHIGVVCGAFRFSKNDLQFPFNGEIATTEESTQP